MSVLVAYASAHGSTKEIAERIGERIQLLLPPDSVTVVAMKDAPKEPTGQAMVIGSAIHAGKWLSHARGYIRNLKVPPNVWAFSVGMMEGDERTKEEAAVEKQIKATIPDLRGHKQFGGKFDINEVNWFLRLMLRCVGEKNFPRGDRRDWAEVEEWADEVAKEVKHMVIT